MMKIRKTPQHKRECYIYDYEDSKVILSPGKYIEIIKSTGKKTEILDKSITKELIRNLHLEDDREVRSNLKYLNVENNKERKIRIKNKKEWDSKHKYGENPYSRPPKLINLDFYTDENVDVDNDKSKLIYEASKNQLDFDIFSEERELLLNYIKTLPQSMQKTFDLHFVKGLNQSEMCNLLGLSKSTISERINRLKNKINEHFSK